MLVSARQGFLKQTWRKRQIVSIEGRFLVLFCSMSRLSTRLSVIVLVLYSMAIMSSAGRDCDEATPAQAFSRKFRCITWSFLRSFTEILGARVDRKACRKKKSIVHQRATISCRCRRLRAVMQDLKGSLSGKKTPNVIL